MAGVDVDVAMTLVVVNPRAGGGRTRDAFPEMKKTIEAALGAVAVAFTEHGGHAIELARAGVRDGHDLVVAVGGDGTFNEVVNGVAGSSAAVGIIGQGTGGDFLRVLGIEHRLDEYLAAIASGRERRIDAMRVEYTKPDGARAERWCVNIVSAGMGGLVDRYVAEASRAFGGKAAYLGASAKALFACRRGLLRCVIDGEAREISSYMMAICNGRYFGSGMKVAPMAEIDDGRLEVVSIDAESKLAFVVNANRIYDGSHIGRPHVVHTSCKRIEIELANEDARERFLIDCDGEPIGKLPMTVEVAPGAVKLRA